MSKVAQDEYIVVSDRDSFGLMRKVQLKMSEGYQPLGGIAFAGLWRSGTYSDKFHEPCYCQAMTLKKRRP